MKNIKDITKYLMDIKKNTDINLFGACKQKIDEWDQETAVEQSHYTVYTKNYFLDINGVEYVLSVEDLKKDIHYAAMEDEFVEDNQTLENKRTISIAPFYAVKQFNYEAKEFAETYIHNKFENDNNIPLAIEVLIEKLESEMKNAQLIKQDPETEARLRERIRRFPDVFIPRYITPIKIDTDVTFDIQLNYDNALDKLDFYDQKVLEKQHTENKPQHELIMPNNIVLNDVRKLNNIVNISGKPSAFLNKFNKYSSDEMTEMSYMMDKGNKVVEIFSKDLDKYEIKPENTQTRKRNQRMR